MEAMLGIVAVTVIGMAVMLAFALLIGVQDYFEGQRTNCRPGGPDDHPSPLDRCR